MKLWQARLRSQKGVTLIELLVVVVILGIIAAVAIPTVIANQEDAYANTNKQNQKIINDALERYAIDNGGKYPSSLAALTTSSGGKGPWLKELPGVFDDNGTEDTTTDATNNLENGWTVTKNNGAVTTVTIPAGYPGGPAQSNP